MVLDLKGLREKLKEFKEMPHEVVVASTKDLNPIINAYVEAIEMIKGKAYNTPFYAEIKFTKDSKKKNIIGQITELSIDPKEEKIKFLLFNKKGKDGERCECRLIDLEAIKSKESRSRLKRFIPFL